ncbi:hypothetical protein NMG60_11001546 [Bertholletia excelsa]
MAEFPPNLDDGELWLPSDIFPQEVPSKFSRPHFPSDLAYMENLARRHAALASLETNQNRTASILARRRAALASLETDQNRTASTPPPNLLRIALPLAHRATSYVPPLRRSYNAGSDATRGRGQGYGMERLRAGFGPAYYCPIRNPVQPQAESFREPRPGFMQIQQNRVLAPRANRVGVGGAGFVRDSGGTGVFHPRIATSSAATNSFTTSASNAGKRPGLENKQEDQAIALRNSIRRADVEKHDLYHQVPPDMGLPQDWTY